MPPTDTPAPTDTPLPPTDTPVPTDTPLPPTDTPLPPTDTPVPTDTPTPTPPPSIFSITPNQGQNTLTVDVVIQGADFFGVPTAQLGSGTTIAVTAATDDTLTGTVPAGITAGVYALTVTNPDAQSDTLAPAYIALTPPDPDTTLETGFLTAYGSDADIAQGDDDHVQLIFFEVPESTGDLYINAYDADTGGANDLVYGGADTTITYTLRGGAGAYTNGDARSSHPLPSGITSGPWYTQTVIGVDASYDDQWRTIFGPFPASEGELIGSSRVFKLVVEGRSGNDANIYNVALSTATSPSNITPAGSRVFAYSWAFVATAAERPPFYAYVPAGTSSFEQHNFDADYNGGQMTLHTPMRDLSVSGSGDISGNGNEEWSSHPVQSQEDGATWSIVMEFAFSVPNNVMTFWTLGDGTDLAIFTHPTMDSPP